MKITEDKLRYTLIDLMQEDAEDTETVQWNAANMIIAYMTNDESKIQEIIKRVIVRQTADTILEILR